MDRSFSSRHRSRPGRRGVPWQRGLSLVELLISMGLLALVAIGILPMWMRSLANNNRAWEATQTANHARSFLEPRLQAPYHAPGLTIAKGRTALEEEHSYGAGVLGIVGDAAEGWYDGTPTDKGQLLFARDTRVRYFRISDLPGWPGGAVVHQTPLSGDVEESQVELKEIQVRLTTVRQAGSLGAGQQRVTFQVYKSF